MNELRQARAALRRDRPSEALVFLWNAIEAARLAGDESALRNVADLARRVAREGDDNERREAERLLEELSELPAAESETAATERVDAEVVVGGEMIRPEPLAEPGAGEPEAPGRRAGALNLIWLLLLLAIVLVNILRGLLGE